jgi:adenylate cyclase
MYGSLLADLGRTEEALAVRRRSVELDPWSLPANNSLGAILSRLGHYDEAVRHLRRALEIDSAYADARGWLGWTLVRVGKVEEGIAESEQAVRVSKNHVRMVSRLANVYAIAGRPADARRLLADLQQRAQTERVPPIFIAHVYAGLGDGDRAFEWLEKAFQEHSPLLARLRSDPQLESLRDDPRYRTLAVRLGLPWP